MSYGVPSKSIIVIGVFVDNATRIPDGQRALSGHGDPIITHPVTVVEAPNGL